MEFPDGLYDLLVTEAVAARLEQETTERQRTLSKLPVDESAQRIAEAFGRHLANVLDEVAGDDCSS